jgi:iron complex outermembrane receptor protein
MRIKAQLLLGIAFGVSVSTAGHAQEAQGVASGADEGEEIVVTGIRGSLANSAAIKRDSNSIVDAISTEDLGKFPDSNVAESLQRIPGVAIDRSSGEGRFVTVRGFGPAFNTVLVNGRTFASDNQGREFSFDLLAAELISGAEVFKSSQARLQDGGIGATLNVKTPRPLELGGFKAVVSAKGNYERNSDKITPQVFGLVSQSFADGTIGLLASVSYQKRDSETRFTQNRGYLPGTTVGPTATPLFTNVFAPRNQDAGIDTQSRERLGVTATAQFRPSEALTFTLDGLYNKFDVDSRVESLGSWFEPSSYTAATIDSNRTVTSLTTNGVGDFIQTSNNRFVKTRAIGGNVEWDVNSNLKVKFDTSWSRAKDDAGGRNYFTVIGIPSAYSFVEAVGSGFPSTVNYSSDLTNPALGRAHIALRTGNDESERVLEHKFDTEWKSDGGALDAVRFGLVNTNRKKSSQTVATNPNTLCIYCGYGVLSDPSLLSPLNLGGFLGGNGSVPTVIQRYDANAYFAFLESAAAAAARDAVGNGTVSFPPGTIAALLASTNGFDAAVQPNSFSISEKVYAGYLDADFKGNLGSMPWVVNIGARYMHTELTANGQQQQLLDLLPVVGDPTIYTGVFANGGVPQATQVKSNYDYFLPNLNIKVNLTDDVVARFSASRTVTRPQVRDLAPRTNFDVLRPASLDASGGNPNLKPYTSNNFDLSLEWYPSATTTLSVAVYYKNIKDFIVQTRSAETFTIANAGNLPVGGLITGPNEATFSVRRPRNAESASVRGLELNAVHSFDYLPSPLDGFGVALNATFVDSNATFDPATTVTSFAVEGLGNSYNATAFFEKAGFEARVAWNRRGRFLEALVTPGQGGDPVFRRAYDQVDMRASYEVLDFAQIFVEGTNVLSSQNITTGRFDNQVLDFVDTGARYAVGVRANF